MADHKTGIELQQTILHGKMLDKLSNIADNSVDSCVTDPPYGLQFMNKQWDYSIPSVQEWQEVYRVLKPGAHMLVACGTRTQHRMVCNIEDAGFEIRDVITWHYGSGFPKSMDISKAIDKEAGAERKVVGRKETKSGGMANVNRANKDQGFRPNNYNEHGNIFELTEAATDAAKEWDGWGTALKPATEFWTLCRKPLSEDTIAQNVLKHGTGGLHINASRIGFSNAADQESATWGRGTNILGGNYVGGTFSSGKENIKANPAGRWPANLILSHHPDCVYIGTKKVSGTFTSNGNAPAGEASKGVISPIRRGTGIDRTDENGLETVEAWQCVDACPVKQMDQQAPKAGAFAPVKTGMPGKSKGVYGDFAQKGDNGSSFHDAGEPGGASRFFYCAKADTAERNKGCENLFWKREDHHFIPITQQEWMLLPEAQQARGNIHVTVKPIDLMRYLVKMITPKYGHCLDPYTGSGTTGVGCKLELINFTGIDMLQENCIISQARIAAWHPPKYIEQTLF